MKNYIDTLNKENVLNKFNDILSRGLCKGIGSPNGQMCIEAAITEALDLPFNDNPICVQRDIKQFKIALNDKNWSSPEARAKGLRNLGIAQLGSNGTVDGKEFLNLLSKKIIQILIPHLFRKIFKSNKNCLDAALVCEKNPTKENATSAANAANAASATSAVNAAYAADAADAANAAYAAKYAADAADAAKYAANAAKYAAYAVDAAKYAANAANAAANATNAAIIIEDEYLIMIANLALETLKELKSPGCAWLN